MCVHACKLSHVQLFVTPWTVAHQAHLSMRLSSQEYWSGLPFPPPGNFLDPRIKPMPPASPALASRFFTTEPPRKPPSKAYVPVFLHFGMEGWEDGRGTAAVADGLMAFLVYWNGRRHILFTGEAGIFLSTAHPFCHKFDQDLGGISCPICPTAL